MGLMKAKPRSEKRHSTFSAYNPFEPYSNKPPLEAVREGR
jgi:hypothetical protein